jgi:hypothetical protein
MLRGKDVGDFKLGGGHAVKPTNLDAVVVGRESDPA